MVAPRVLHSFVDSRERNLQQRLHTCINPQVSQCLHLVLHDLHPDAEVVGQGVGHCLPDEPLVVPHRAGQHEQRVASQRQQETQHLPHFQFGDGLHAPKPQQQLIVEEVHRGGQGLDPMGRWIRPNDVIQGQGRCEGRQSLGVRDHGRHEGPERRQRRGQEVGPGSPVPVVHDQGLRGAHIEGLGGIVLQPTEGRVGQLHCGGQLLDEVRRGAGRILWIE
mmetsp:Transcript_151173/g.264157  ORF Transcript_151173/g.264157 Transcript_151173/m.264157 type:complete len:220 (+) Transcript_151173:868-1527(+)